MYNIVVEKKTLILLKPILTLPETPLYARATACVYFMLLMSSLSAQVSMQSNLPDSLPTNSERIIDITIAKPELYNFAKYQIELPEGSVAEELESKGGTFSYENKRAKIVWVIAPTDSVFRISIKLLTGPLTGAFNVEQRFSYIVDGNRKEVDAPTRKIFIYKQGRPDRKMISGPKSTSTIVLPSSNTVAPLSEQAIASNQNLANQGTYAQQLVAMKQQAAQFRDDSKKAYELGSKEKSEAEKHRAEAEEAITKANSLQNETERNQALNNANLLKERAEASNSAADKILSLSRTLENEAIELEMAIEERSTQTLTTNTGEPVSTGNESILSSGSATQSPLLAGYENRKIDRLSQREIEELRQQAGQFRKDAAEAMEVGLREKETAGKKLREAEETIKNAEDIKNKNEKKKVLSKAETAKQKAESDLQTSEKIIILSRTLDENANEIERLIDYLQPSTPSLSPTATEEVPEETPLVSKSGLAETKENTTTVESQATVYMVQVGAFKNKPDKAILKKLGKYKVVTEDDKYKVLVGPFSTKEEASAKRDELVPMGFDGFVVVYEKGKRKK